MLNWLMHNPSIWTYVTYAISYCIITIVYSMAHIYFKLDIAWDKKWDGKGLYPPIPFTFAKYLWFIFVPFQMISWFFKLINYLATDLPTYLRDKRATKKIKKLQAEQEKKEASKLDPKKIRISLGNDSYRSYNYVDLIESPNGKLIANVCIDGVSTTFNENELIKKLSK